MKRTILTSVFFLLTAALTNAQSEKFQTAMGSALQEYGAAKDAASLIAVEAKFERIGDAEKTQWLPYYYAALIKTSMSLAKMGDPDKLADDAASLIEKAKSIESNCETLVLEAMIATAKLVVNPQERYMEYGQKSNQLLEKAKLADATNPRPYVFQSQTLRQTPEAYGGGCAPAKPLAQKALELFASFKPASPLHPNWGKEQVEKIIEDCK
jgi:hypothetical protein